MDLSRQSDDLCGAEGGLFKSQLKGVFDVFARLWAFGFLLPKVKTKDVAKCIAELIEDVFDGFKSGAIGEAVCVVSKQVVLFALLIANQNLIRLGEFLELALRFRVVWVSVGMAHHGQLVEGAFDLPTCGIARDPEYVVIVAFGHGLV